MQWDQAFAAALYWVRTAVLFQIGKWGMQRKRKLRRNTRDPWCHVGIGRGVDRPQNKANY